VKSGVNIKLFSRIILEHIRAVMLIRHLPSKQSEILSAFGTEMQAKLAEFANGASPLNSHLLLSFIKATELVDRSPIPQAPLEIAVIETTEK
jgi:hypothetical protein